MKKSLILASALVFAITGVVGFSPSVQAKKKEKITICHRTNSVKNPYRQITVNQNAADGIAGNSGQKPDHYDEHQGSLVTSEAEAQALKDNKTKWGDIIPPIVDVHDGLNWTTEGQAIYNNDCQYVVEPEEPETPTTPTTPTTPVTPSSTAITEPIEKVQAEAPEAGVNAGGGGALSSVAAPVAGFIGSLGSLAYGIIRFRKFGA